MGKNKRATRKELEETVEKLIKRMRALEEWLQNAFTAMDGYIGLYVEWKGDGIEFPAYVKKKLGESQIKARTPDMESNSKNEKRDRYKKISQPL